MSTKQRRRPGKNNRRKATARAWARYVDRVVSETGRTGTDKPASRCKWGGPRDLSRSSADKSTLRLGTYGTGFRGPRGFATPKYLVSEAERSKTPLIPDDTVRATSSRSKPFARDGFGDGNGAALREQRAERRAGGKGRFKALPGTESRERPAARVRRQRRSPDAD